MEQTMDGAHDYYNAFYVSECAVWGVTLFGSGRSGMAGRLDGRRGERVRWLAMSLNGSKVDETQ